MQSTKWSLKDRVVHATKLLRLHGFTNIKLIEPVLELKSPKATLALPPNTRPNKLLDV